MLQDLNEKELVKINRFYSLKLSDREWVCKCGETHDRDLNASKNIWGTCHYKCG